MNTPLMIAAVIDCLALTELIATVSSRELGRDHLSFCSAHVEKKNQ